MGIYIILPVGQFGDDCLQKISGNFSLCNPAQGVYAGMFLTATGAFKKQYNVPNTYYKPEAWSQPGGDGIIDFDSTMVTRYNNNVTRGKRKGIVYLIKVL